MDKKRLAIIGGGPAGFISAISFAENSQSSESFHIDIFEKNVPLKTILCTGNGRCNLSHNIADFKELVKYYPRGEKFLYSVFSQFGVDETLKWFNSYGLKTYTQPDGRIFPKTDSAVTVREFFLNKASEYAIYSINQGVCEVAKLENRFIVRTKTAQFEYDAVIISTGGNRKNNIGYELAKMLGHNIVEPKPALTSLISGEKWLKQLAGVSIKNSRVQSFFNNKKISDIKGDFIFTHNGLAGPVIFNTSSYCCFLDYSTQNPLILKINFLPSFSREELKGELSLEINNFPDKAISNIFKKYIPKSLIVELLSLSGINPDRRSSGITDKEMEKIINMLQESSISIISPAGDGEIVTAGGIDLKEINPRTMESKIVDNLFFCGEILNIDGLTGGFNLQMCWSTGYIAGKNAVNSGL